jgi:hypothetical protein
MTHHEIITTINGIPAGRFFRMSYTSELPVKAAHKKSGVRVHKIVETTVRTGVAYDNIKAVKEYKATHEPKLTTPRANNYEWLSKNRIKYNTNTEKTYVVVATIPNGGNKKCKYLVSDNNGSRVVETDALDKDLIIDSYWSKGESPDVVRTIAVDHILDINV